MKPELQAKVETIIQEKKEGKGTFSALCKKHGLAESYFYVARKKLVTFKKPRRKYNKAPKVLDIPLQTKPEFVIICRAEDAAKVMGSL